MESSIQYLLERFLLGLISILLLTYYLNEYKKRKWEARNTYSVEFEIEHQKIFLKAFLDTGNFITYGIQNEPVIIASKESIKKQISNESFTHITEIVENNHFLKNKCLLAYQLVDGTLKKEWGLKVKKTCISNHQISLIKDIVLLISNQDFKEFDALIGLNVLEGGMIDGNDMDVSSKGSEIFC